jgi:hypothetical protein
MATTAVAVQAGVHLVVAKSTTGVFHPRVRRERGDPYAFTDVAGLVGVSDGGHHASWGVSWVDIDRNGYPDLFLGRHRDPPRLLTNTGGNYDINSFDFCRPPGYVPTHEEPCVDRHMCAWGEANGDGRPDLYCTQGAQSGAGSGPNQLLVQTTDGFQDVARAMAVADIYGRGRSANWLDVDGDGKLDLFVGNANRWTRPPSPNRLFMHIGEKFRSVPGADDSLQTKSSSWADWDVDGDPDLLVLQDQLLSRYPARAYEDVDGRLMSVEIPHVSGGLWQAAAWGDYDGDGRPDLSLLSPHRLLVLRNTAGGFEHVFNRPLAVGRMSVWFDVDNDGDLDLFVVQGALPQTGRGRDLQNYPDFLVVREAGGFRTITGTPFRGPQTGCTDAVAAADDNRDGRVDLVVTNGCTVPDELLRNDSGAGGWVALDLHGSHTNPWGFGARIHVAAGPLGYWRELTDGVSSHGQSEMGHQVLGIGLAESAHVRVVWPNGVSDCVGATAGETVALVVGTRPC